MTRRAFMQMPVLGAASASSGDESYVISYGKVDGAEHEIAEGYFALNQGTAIMVRPGSSGWQRLKELKGKAVSLIVRVDE